MSCLNMELQQIQRIFTVGRWDQMILDSSGNARKSLRLGVMSCSRKLSTGAIDGSSSCKFLRSSFEYSEENLRARTPRGAIHSSALSNSSIQGVVKVLPIHCLQTGRETPSALQWARPGRCSMT